MSTKGTKSTKKPKVMPVGLGLSPDGLQFSQNFPSPSRAPSSIRSPILSDDDENGSRGRSSSARRTKLRGAEESYIEQIFQLLTDATSPKIPLSPSSIASGFGGNARMNKPKPLKVEDCLNKMLEFVKDHDLRPILGRDLTDEELREHLLPQAKIAAQLPINLKYVNRELVMQLAILSLYDLAVLIDDSISMEFEEAGRRKTAVKGVLAFIADIYGAVSEKQRGIRAIRFLNGNDDLEADNIQTREQIDEVIDNHEFEGLTRIGTGLMQKILKPFVFDDAKWNKSSKEARNLKQLERPLLIMVITDGAVEGEPPSRLRQAIQSVVDSLKKANFNPETTKAIAFQFARVGNDRDAQKFLEHLDNKSSVKDYVDTLSGGDLMEIMGMRTKDKALTEKHQRRMIKLLLGPISSRYDKMASKEKKSKQLQTDIGYNSADDFDDEEDEDDVDAEEEEEEGEEEEEDDDDDDDYDDEDDDESYAGQKQTNGKQGNNTGVNNVDDGSEDENGSQS
ncbi:hypothetical protein EV426DRAFT_576873 [Tirmania nivea]|nr:hypothetical protein EV426DRAFT_576873 [Tirmania nivea]